MFADATTAVVIFAALYGGHHVGDFWVQSDHQAQTKGACGHTGRAACAGHVMTLTATQAVLVGVVLVATATPVNPVAVVLGFAVNAGSHYWADRRTTLAGLVYAVDRLNGKSGFYAHVPGAHMHLDQAWHIGWLVPAALVMAAPTVGALVGAAGAALLLGGCEAASRYGRRLVTV